MLEQSLSPTGARALIRRIVDQGEVDFWHHAKEEMDNDRLSQADCLNVLRGGWPDPAESHHGHWRYQIHTRTMCAVVQFESSTHLSVVTMWRK